MLTFLCRLYVLHWPDDGRIAAETSCRFSMHREKNWHEIDGRTEKHEGGRRVTLIYSEYGVPYKHQVGGKKFHLLDSVSLRKMLRAFYNVFYVHGSLHRESMSIIVRDTTIYSFIIFLQTALHISDDTLTHHQENTQTVITTSGTGRSAMDKTAVLIQMCVI